jgi:hypothetical protein
MNMYEVTYSVNGGVYSRTRLALAPNSQTAASDVLSSLNAPGARITGVMAV